MIYVIEKNGKRAVVRSSSKPMHSIGICPIDPLTGEPEDPEWLQLEMIDDGTGLLVPTLTVNQIEKDRIMAERTAEQQAATEEKDRKRNKLRKIYKRVRKAKKNDIKDLDSIRDRLHDLEQVVKEILTSEADDAE